MSDKLNKTDPSIPNYVNLILKITGAHLGVSSQGSDEPNMWLEAETDGRYSVNLGDERIDQLGRGSPNSKATISVDRSVKGLPFILVEKHKSSFILRVLCTCEDKFFEELASSIRSGNIPAYAKFELSPNPYISELTWENPLPVTNWKDRRSDPMVIHKQVFTYKTFGTLDEVMRTETLEKFSSLSDQITTVENQLFTVKKENQEWRNEVASNFKIILIAAIVFILIFSLLI